MPPLNSDDVVRVKEQQWGRRAVVLEEVKPRSYEPEQRMEESTSRTGGIFSKSKNHTVLSMSIRRRRQEEEEVEKRWKIHLPQVPQIWLHLEKIQET